MWNNPTFEEIIESLIYLRDNIIENNAEKEMKLEEKWYLPNCIASAINFMEKYKYYDKNNYPTTDEIKKETAKNIWNDFKLKMNHFNDCEWKMVKIIFAKNGVEVEENLQN